MDEQSIGVEGLRQGVVAQRHVVVALHDVTEVTALLEGAKGRGLHDAIGVVTRHARIDERQQDRVGEDESE